MSNAPDRVTKLGGALKRAKERADAIAAENVTLIARVAELEANAVEYRKALIETETLADRVAELETFIRPIAESPGHDIECECARGPCTCAVGPARRLLGLPDDDPTESATASVGEKQEPLAPTNVYGFGYPEDAHRPSEAEAEPEEMFSVERTEAGRIFVSATLKGHVGHAIMSEATAALVHRALGILLGGKRTNEANPLPVITVCPVCKQQHIDEQEWATRAHRTHRCVSGPFGKGCGSEWTVAAVPTVGVRYDDLGLKAQRTDSALPKSGIDSTSLDAGAPAQHDASHGEQESVGAERVGVGAEHRSGEAAARSGDGGGPEGLRGRGAHDASEGRRRSDVAHLSAERGGPVGGDGAADLRGLRHVAGRPGGAAGSAGQADTGGVRGDHREARVAQRTEACPECDTPLDGLAATLGCKTCDRRHAQRTETAPLTLLRKLEWAGGAQAGIGDGTDPCCPSCGAWAYDRKHDADCELAAALASQTGSDGT